MTRVCDSGHAPVRVRSGDRCRECSRARSARRGSPTRQGYGMDHKRARLGLLETLPVPCAYGCGRVLSLPSEMVAAHVVDGRPEYGWQASCRRCNELAKSRHQAVSA